MINTRELPQLAKVKVEVLNTDTGEKSEEILTYYGMDGMYGKFLDTDGSTLNACGKHKQVEDGLYIFIDDDE